jgi:hypothetical protein
MKTDKEFALDLLRHLEECVIRISILEHLLKNSNVKDWRERIDALMAQGRGGARELTHQQFAQWHDTILNSPDITSVACEILGSISLDGPSGSNP